MNKLFKIITFVPRKAWNITKNVNKVFEAPTEACAVLSIFNSATVY